MASLSQALFSSSAKNGGMMKKLALAMACLFAVGVAQADDKGGFSLADDENKAWLRLAIFTKSIVLISSNIRMSLSLRSWRNETRGKY